MNKTEKKIVQCAKRFAIRRAGKCWEMGQSELFWTELLKAHRNNIPAIMTSDAFLTTM